MEALNIKGVIFDYGGTIDSGGEHWSEVIYRGWKKAGLDVEMSLFREAYVFAERELAKVRHIMPDDDFLSLLQKKMRIELSYLVENSDIKIADIDEKADEIAGYCDDAARGWVERAKPVLQKLHARYPMVLVSNFYGNVEAVLRSYGLLEYFKEIVESAVVGVRKPDPEIFRLGVRALGLPAEEIVVIGDSYKKDIVPAEKAGCKAIWIKGKGWTDEEDAIEYPRIIKSLEELPAILGV